jgi:hypothetical protein
MINQDDYQPWYPYYVYRMIGSSLAVGDQVVEATSSSADLRALAWTHNGMLKILLVCTIDEPRTMYLQGATGKASLLKIDNTIPWTTPNEQSQVVDLGAPLTLNGYTVALLTIGSQNGLSISNSGDIAVGIGGSGSNTISVAVAGALPDSIALSCVNGLPSGASCNFNPEFGNTSFSSNLTISTSSSTPVGTFSVKVAGTAGQISNFTSFTLTVNAPKFAGDITSVTISPNPVRRSQTATFSIKIMNTGTSVWPRAKATLEIYSPNGSLLDTRELSLRNSQPGVEYSSSVKWKTPSSGVTGSYQYVVHLYYGSLLLDEQTGTLEVR